MTDYIPREGDVVAFLLWPDDGNRVPEYTVTSVWADGSECTLHRYVDGDDYVYPGMSVTEMRDQGVRLIRTGQPVGSGTRADDEAARSHAAVMSEHLGRDVVLVNPHGKSPQLGAGTGVRQGVPGIARRGGRPGRSAQERYGPRR